MLRTILLILLLNPCVSSAQAHYIDFTFRKDIHIVIDVPSSFNYKKTNLVLFALPNGNTIEQTMGKLLQPGDDWHFDIQHIKAQTAFIRKQSYQNYIVAYLENNFKSWPRWKQEHAQNFNEEIRGLIDTLQQILHLKKHDLHLSSHSGGGSFIFGFLKTYETVPAFVTRITFIDSNYGFDSTYTESLSQWAKKQNHYLTVFAYNDSVVQYNGKPLVSAKGGTWYKSHEMMKELKYGWRQKKLSDSLSHYKNAAANINFFLINNPSHAILHTFQVEKNGFIHSELIGTQWENKNYTYFKERAYSEFISSEKLK
ncbi:MAG: hypothetical protein JWN76_637 [Chitinophagaceae bacterium]|nr:hypothetical protein [Chitinophagaceae bacterium]